MATERIDIVISERGSKEVERNIQDVGSSARRASGAVELLKNALSTLSVGLVVRELVRLVDAYTNMQNRLKTVTTGTAQLAAVTDELFQIANRTRQSFQGTAEIYSRVSLSVKQLGVSQKDALVFTESLNKAVALSGSTAIESENALVQFSQGLSSGVLRGDELRSVLEQLPAVADVLAKSLGVTRGELRVLGEQGKLTTQVILEAFRKASTELDENFAKTVPTLGQAFVVLRNNLLRLVGEFDQANGISRSLAQGIIVVANNIEVLSRAIVSISLVIGVVFAQRAIGAAITAVRALTVAIAANPLGALALAVVATISLLISFSDKIRVGQGRLANLRDLAVAVWESIKNGVSALVNFFSANFPSISKVGDKVFGGLSFSIEGVLKFSAKVIDKFIGIFVGSYNVIVTTFSGLPAVFSDIFSRALNTTIELVEASVNKIISAINKVSEFAGIGSIGNVILGRVSNNAAEEAKNLSSLINKGLLEGLNQNTVENSIDKLFNRADQIALKRIEKEDKAKKELEQGKSELSVKGEAVKSTGLTPKAADLKSSGGSKGSDIDQLLERLTPEKQATFDDLLNKMKTEGEILKQNRQEREIQQNVLQLETELKRNLTLEERGLAEEQIRLNQSLQQQTSILDEITGPIEDYGQTVNSLDQLLKNGNITLGEYSEKLQEVKLSFLETQTDLSSGLERAFIKISRDFADSGKQIEEIATSTFNKAQESLTQFVTTGKLDFRGLADSIINDLIRITVQQGIVKPIAGAVGSLFGGGGGIGGLFGGGGGIGGGIASGLGSLFGFASGGDFTVPGAGGVDSQLVAFRATPGEQVIVNKPNTDYQQKDSAGGKTVVNMYINTPDVKGFKESESQLAARASRMIGRGRRNL